MTQKEIRLALQLDGPRLWSIADTYSVHDYKQSNEEMSAIPQSIWEDEMK